jgi:hypothetical protein
MSDIFIIVNLASRSQLLSSTMCDFLFHLFFVPNLFVAHINFSEFLVIFSFLKEIHVVLMLSI